MYVSNDCRSSMSSGHHSRNQHFSMFTLVLHLVHSLKTADAMVAWRLAIASETEIGGRCKARARS